MKKKIIINPRYIQLGSFIEHIPDVFEQEGTVISQGRKVIKSFEVHCQVGDMTVIVKRYKLPDIFQRIGDSFFRSTSLAKLMRMPGATTSWLLHP